MSSAVASGASVGWNDLLGCGFTLISRTLFFHKRSSRSAVHAIHDSLPKRWRPPVRHKMMRPLLTSELPGLGPFHT
ncbi:hypothetical protein, partial [uncultured Abyssibacter sp.]|uniref:hypothetical protein n=1 Tax=uncultured Abyssibacter sp. TaxID=2320202 RepID=UPI0032B1350C